MTELSFLILLLFILCWIYASICLFDALRHIKNEKLEQRKLITGANYAKKSNEKNPRPERSRKAISGLVKRA